jgi:hypothetical protein
VSYQYDQGPSICEGCMASKGICGTNMTHPDKEFMCLCRDHPYAFVCQGKLGMPHSPFFPLLISSSELIYIYIYIYIYIVKIRLF